MFQSAKELANKAAHRVGNLIENSTGKVVGVVTLATGSGSALAAPPDFSTLTSAVDWTTVTAALLGIAAGVAVVYITWKGAKMIVAAIRGA